MTGVGIEFDLTPRAWSGWSAEEIAHLISSLIKEELVQEVRATRHKLLTVLSPTPTDTTIDAIRRRLEKLVDIVSAATPKEVQRFALTQAERFMITQAAEMYDAVETLEKANPPSKDGHYHFPPRED